ncbi:MAG: TatD family deoxyribonuclease [Ruminococcaceae bacterium]|nr:TatD family deoxyribonuclease [Oscillospiraceae bacterium]
MYRNIFDTHAHYDDRRFDEDRAELLSSLFGGSVSGIINCGCDLKSSLETVALTEKYPNLYGAVGVHPHEAEETTQEDLEKIKELYKKEKIVAVGEIGLDYFYDFSPREKQIEIFRRQLVTANELNLPVIIHDRDAHEDTLTILKELKPKGVVHCFSGSAEMAREILKLGLYIGIGGAVTFKNARKPVEVVEMLPLDRLLLETDAPYMTPVPFRGKRCDSSHIAYTAEKIAEIKGMDVQELIDKCAENAKALFGI